MGQREGEGQAAVSFRPARQPFWNVPYGSPRWSQGRGKSGKRSAKGNGKAWWASCPLDVHFEMPRRVTRLSCALGAVYSVQAFGDRQSWLRFAEALQRERGA